MHPLAGAKRWSPSWGRAWPSFWQCSLLWLEPLSSPSSLRAPSLQPSWQLPSPSWRSPSPSWQFPSLSWTLLSPLPWQPEFTGKKGAYVKSSSIRLSLALISAPSDQRNCSCTVGPRTADGAVGGENVPFRPDPHPSAPLALPETPAEYWLLPPA